MVIPVRLGPHSYAIVVERGALGTLGARLSELGVGSRAALVSAPAILRLYGKTVVASLDGAGISVATVEVPDGEAAKTLPVAERAWNALLEAAPDPTSTARAPGGGAVGDPAGFVAATYPRAGKPGQVPRR